MAQINFPTATSNGQTFEADNGVIYTYVGTPPNGFWSGSFQATGLTTLDARFLKLDSSNDPVTGGLNITGGNVGIGTSSPSAKLEISEDSSTTPARMRFVNVGDRSVAVGFNDHNASPNFCVSNGDSSIHYVNINAIGNVGLGLAAPTSPLHLQKDTGSIINLGTGTTTANSTQGFNFYGRFISGTTPAAPGQLTSFIREGRQGSNAEFDLIFGTSTSSDATEKMRLTAIGSLGIGTSNPHAKIHVSSGDVGFSPGVNADELFLENTGNCGLTIGCGTNQTSNIYFAEQGVGVSRGAIVYDTNDDYMAFSTAGLVNERMRINSNGNIVCGSTSTTISDLYTLQATGSRGAVIKSTGGGGNPTQTLWNQNSSGDSTLLEFRVNTNDTTVGNIVHDRSAGLIVYNTTSDYRAKTLNGRVENSGLIIDQLKVYNGTMNGASIELPMLVAHEAQEVVPYCVTGTKDAVDSEGNPIYQGMDVSKLVPLLIAEIQELRKRLSDAGI